MSRSGYWEYDGDVPDTTGLWRANVMRTARGRRGRAFLQEMLDALDAMPAKKLIAHNIVREDGCVCAMGAVAVRRGLDVSDIDPECPKEVAERLGISSMLAREIAYTNDEWNWSRESDEDRWKRMRAWVVSMLEQTK